MAAKIDELDRPKPAEIIKDVVSFLERAETLAVLAGDTGLADALANASELIKTYNRKKNMINIYRKNL